MPLEEYRRKRDFDVTPEPPPEVPDRSGEALSYVVQKHAATRLHYDFRLELDGVLVSWAVPKGPSLDPGERRLAVHVEDHPLAYGDFEGAIPAGQYGGGTVLLWDRGRWVPDGDPVRGLERGKLDFRLHGEKLRGAFKLVRMGGRAAQDGDNWLLIKRTDDDARPGSGDAVVREHPESVVTGKTLEEIAADPGRVWDSKRGDVATPAPLESGDTGKRAPAARSEPPAELAPGELEGARRASLPRDEAPFDPELASLVSEAPAGDGWLHEIKYDGYRLLAALSPLGGKTGREKSSSAAAGVRLWTRRGNDWTDRFPELARALATLPVDSAVLDGEAVVVLPDGTTSFQRLQNRLGRFGRGSGSDAAEDGGVLAFYAFDLLHLDGWDLRQVPLVRRKRLLADLLAPAGDDAAEDAERLRYSDHVEGRGAEFHRQACRLALEGIVSKRAEAPYRRGRQRDWVKTKCLHRQELVVGGYTKPSGSRQGLGALLLGWYRGEELVYAGKVGTGFTTETLRELARHLERIERPTPPFVDPPRGYKARGARWVEPRLVAEVEFTEWTDEGHLRHPSFQGLREDKAPREVTREVESAPPAREDAVEADESEEEPMGEAGASGKKRRGRSAAAGGESKGAAGKASRERGGASGGRPRAASKSGGGSGGRSRSGATEVLGVRLTNPDRVLYPEQGVTKLDLARYYAEVGERIFPHVADRPLSLVRCPSGRGGECFYQKHLTGTLPEAIGSVPVPEKDGEERDYAKIDSVAGVVALVQMGVLEIHPWGSRADRLERPDRMVFDLDPGPGIPWRRIVEGARLVRAVLTELGLESFLKTTGGKGFHVVVPLVRRHGFDEVKAFSRALAEALAASDPKGWTANLSKAEREGRIFLDYLRNGRGATAVAAYSSRARPGAPVSVPVAWEELGPELAPDRWTVTDLPQRLAELDRDPWEGFDGIRQSITKPMRRALGLEPG